MSYALLIMTVFFFLMPSAFRAARMSLSKKENNVKDWLPADFSETAELEWFADHFAGESFVLATWEGCDEGDQRLKLFTRKLFHESAQYNPSESFSPAMAAAYQRAKKIGEDLQLIRGSDELTNWGGQNEKWMQSSDGQWYYVTPEGGFYRWEELMNGPAGLIRSIKRSRGTYELKGKFITAFVVAGQDESKTNPFYNDPSLICAPLFATVQTGSMIVDQLARPGGPLWPVDMTDPLKRATVARRLAMQRLTGMLFAPAVPPEFDWSVAAFRQAVAADQIDSLPEVFDDDVKLAVEEVVSQDFGGSLKQLAGAPDEEQANAWYAVWDAVQVKPPPRTTCVMVTFTDLAKDHLGYAIGRGVLGQQRGRFLELADESGIYAARPPSMAPPPFNTQPVESIASMPALRLGGPTVDNQAIDEEGTVTLVRLVGYSVLIGIVLSYLCFRSVKITIMIFVVGGSSAMLSMAMVWWTGGHVDAILMSMPSLVYVLGLSGAIHVVNYYRDEVRARGEVGAAGRALRHAVIPCTLASLTTAIGLISLFTSNLAPISNFGLYSAIGVIATLGVLFSYLPSALHAFAPKVTGVKPEQKVDPSQPRVEGAMSQWWATVGRLITKHHAVVTLGCIAVLVLSAVGMTRIKTSVQLLELFDSDARIIRDYAWLESNFGKLVPMELVLRMPESMQAETEAGKDSPLSMSMLQRVEAVARMRQVVHRTLGEPGMDVVGQATGADTFLPPLPGRTNGYSPIRSKFNREFIKAREQLLANDYLKVEQTGPYQGSELWRISLRVAALSDVDYGHFVMTVREAATPVLNAHYTRDKILKAVSVKSDDGTWAVKQNAKVLFVGEQRPKSLANTPLYVHTEQDSKNADSPDGDLSDTDSLDTGPPSDSPILTRNAYLATLGELLASERIRKPRWLSLSPEKTKTLVQSDRWNSILDSFDVVVWIGEDHVYAPEHFDSAKNFIDARGDDGVMPQRILVAKDIPSILIGGVEDKESIQAVYTGVIPVVYKAQRTLLTSLADSIGLAFVLIALVMIVLLNPGNGVLEKFRPSHLGYGIAAGAVAMIPNVFPVLMIFGLMCHMGIEIDIGTMMTASVAMGVAVDDTIHFLAWFRENLDKGIGRVEAVIETYRRVGPAMTQTTIVGGFGLFVFALSTFTPTQRFGTLMLVMLFAALIGDLVLLPALLAGPLGRFFKPRAVPQTQEPSMRQPVPEALAASVEAETSHTHPPRSSIAQNIPVEEDIPQLRIHFPPDRLGSSSRLPRK